MEKGSCQWVYLQYLRKLCSIDTSQTNECWREFLSLKKYENKIYSREAQSSSKIPHILLGSMTGLVIQGKWHINDYYHFIADSSLKFLNEKFFIPHIEKPISGIFGKIYHRLF